MLVPGTPTSVSQIPRDSKEPPSLPLPKQAIASNIPTTSSNTTQHITPLTGVIVVAPTVTEEIINSGSPPISPSTSEKIPPPPAVVTKQITPPSQKITSLRATTPPTIEEMVETENDVTEKKKSESHADADKKVMVQYIVKYVRIILIV